MAKLIRTQSGAFFQETPQGLAAINDPRTLAALYQGQIPYENLATTEGQTFSSGVASPNLISQPTGMVSDTSGATETASAGQDTTNPITKFNLAILDMLKKAQSGQLVAQQNKDELQRSAYQSGMEQFTGTEAIMTPEAKMATLDRNVQMYKPSVEAANMKIKQFGDIMDLMKKTYGEDMSAMLPATEEDAAIYKRAMQEGWTPPIEIVKKYGKFFTTEDWHAAAVVNQKGTAETEKLVPWSEWAAKLGIVGAPAEVGMTMAMKEAQNEQKSTRERQLASVRTNIYSYIRQIKEEKTNITREQFIEQLVSSHELLTRDEITTEVYGLTKELEIEKKKFLGIF